MNFSRRRGDSGRHAASSKQRQTSPRHAAGRRGNADLPAPDDVAADQPDRSLDQANYGPGPYDVSEAPSGVTRLDLGSLLIPAVAGVEVRVQANQEGVIQQVVLVSGDNLLQISVLAAPRSEGIWDEVRADIRQSLAADGVRVEELPGTYGPELRARVRTPDGPADLRFIGIDGPRWMVQAVYQGPAAIDPARAKPLAECLAGLVVNRGTEAMPVRDPLPLRLPRDLAARAEAAHAAQAEAARAGQARPATDTQQSVSPPNGRASGGSSGAGRSSRRRRG